MMMMLIVMRWWGDDDSDGADGDTASKFLMNLKIQALLVVVCRREVNCISSTVFVLLDSE